MIAHLKLFNAHFLSTVRDTLLMLLFSLQMLSVGVDRVVDQVINTKVISDFKPQVDRVICEYLGVDYDKWMDRQSAYCTQFFIYMLNYVHTACWSYKLKCS